MWKQRIADTLNFDPAGFAQDGERLVILRHTLMNPYLIDQENGSATSTVT